MSATNELMELDFYEVLGISIEATDAEIKKSYRKTALSCHPDKNPDNPKAAAEFNRLQKIFKILENPVEKLKYDKVVKGRKLATIRARERNAHSQKLKYDLDRREKEAKIKLSDADRLAREVQRLKEEGDQLIAEQIDMMKRDLQKEKKRAASQREEQTIPAPSTDQNLNTDQTTLSGSYRVKVKWLTEEGKEAYSKEQIHNLFYKWGELNAVAIKQKGQKGTALVDYKDESGAEMAVQFERGLDDCVLTVRHLAVKSLNIKQQPSYNPTTDTPSTNNSMENGSSKANKNKYESVADMNKRRQNERARLMAEMLRSDGVEDCD